MPPSSSRANKPGQRALVVGIGDYPAPFKKLPAVSADVREIAKLLGSKNGAFPDKNIKLLRDREATRSQVASALKRVLAGAGQDDTVFVYLAGHGDIDNGEYAFVTYDTDPTALAKTGIPLTLIRALFEQSLSHQVFLWLDFCHSGGILARSFGGTDDRNIIQRTLSVVQGRGKVILAACTESQSAYEDSKIGHGLFTNALLRGLKGEAVAGGEVTANSLFDFIDREVGSHRQRPMYFGKLTGRIVLMHYQRPATGAAKKPPKASARAKRPRTSSARGKRTWVMLDRFFFPARSVRHRQDGLFTVQIAPANAEDEANLHPLLPDKYGSRSSIPFAARNEAHLVRVKECDKEMSSDRPVWTLTLAPEDSGFGGSGMEPSFRQGGNTYSPDDLAHLRARRLLLNDPPPRSPENRGFDTGSLLEGFITGSSRRYPVTECVVRSVFAKHGRSLHWRELARLQAVFLLKMSGTVEHVLDLTIGPVRAGKVAVKFRGRRPRYSNVDPTEIEVSGGCTLR